MARRLQGVLPIVHTPFTDSDEIDVAALQREIDWAYAQGADGLGTGMVSELLRLTFDERMMKVLTDPKSEFEALREAADNLANLGAELNQRDRR